MHVGHARYWLGDTFDVSLEGPETYVHKLDATCLELISLHYAIA